MPYWLTNLIVISLVVMIFLIILGVAIMQFSYRLQVEKEKNRQLEKENRHKQQIIDAYGFKEFTIGKENEK